VPVTAASVPAVGERLRDARLARGIGLRSLARDLGVSASLISQIETGKSQPSVSTLYAITSALGISIEHVFEPRAAPGPVQAERTGAPGDAAAGLAAGDAAAANSGSLAVDPDAPDDAGAAADSVDPAGAVPGGLGTLMDVLGAARGHRVGPLVRPAQRQALALDSGVTWQRLGHLPDTAVDFLLITYEPGGSSSSSGLLMRHSGAEYGYLLSGELVLTLGFDEHRLRAGDSVCFESTQPHCYRNEGSTPAVGVWFVIEPG
jgi:transcriptional regulator with XRE-family HTH domain/quercetin dioxygenase-like cupin family protein